MDWECWDSVSVKTNYFWSPEDPTLTVRHAKTKRNLVIRFFAHSSSLPIDYDTAINQASAPLMHFGICDYHWFQSQ